MPCLQRHAYLPLVRAHYTGYRAPASITPAHLVKFRTDSRRLPATLLEGGVKGIPTIILPGRKESSAWDFPGKVLF